MLTRAFLPLALAMALAAGGSIQAQAPQAGTVSGTFTVAGKATKMTHVYASIGPGFFDKKKQDITVTVTDVELTPAQLADHFALSDLASAGKAHAIVFVIDDTKQIISCQLHDQAFKMSASTAGTNNQFDATTFTKTRIAGKAHTQKADTFGPKDVAYEYAITFDTPIKTEK
jgi:hypothetical protein